MKTLQFNKVKRVTLTFVRLSKILQVPNVNTFEQQQRQQQQLQQSHCTSHEKANKTLNYRHR